MKFTAENFVTIQGWMVTDLGLKGNDLLLYAAIFGFSQKEGQWFTGGQQYLAELCKCDPRSVRRNIEKLVDLGLVEVSFSESDARWNRYRTTDVRTLEDNMSSNKKQDIMSSKQDNMSPISSELEDIRDKNRGHNVRQNINNNNIYINKAEAEETRACAREASAAAPILELYPENCEMIVRVWNDQKTTQNMKTFPIIGRRYENTRICVQYSGSFGKFIGVIHSLDSQAWFRKRSEAGKKLGYDWFCNPNNFLKIIEGNYEKDFDSNDVPEGWEVIK